jgi:hypothetical protein
VGAAEPGIREQGLDLGVPGDQPGHIPSGSADRGDRRAGPQGAQERRDVQNVGPRKG